jgi:uncharacterized membrane protein
MILLKNIRTYIGLPAKYVYYLVAVLVAALIIFKSVDYLRPDFSRGFLFGKEKVFEKGYKYFLYAHMFTGPLTIFAGILQFTLKRTTKIHRVSGYVYIVGAIIASLSGLYMSFYSIGGLASGASFFILAVLWLYFTVRAFTEIRKRNVIQHQRFMTRSFILANSAVLLRVFSFLFAILSRIDPTEAYILIAWLCWAPWLAAYEIWLLMRKKIPA